MIRPVALAAVALLLALAPLAAGGKKTFVYAHDRGATDRVWAFQVAKDGTLKALEGSPFVGPDGGGLCGGLCQTMTWSAHRKALITGGPNGLTVYKVPKSGKLKVITGSPFGVGTSGQLGTAAVKKGKKSFVYSAEYAADRLRAYELTKDRTLVELVSSPMAVGDGPNGLDARDDTLLLSLENDLTLSACRVAKDGTLSTPQSSTVSVGFSFSGALSPDAAFAYHSDYFGYLRAFSVDPETSALAGLAGNPVDTTLPEAVDGVRVGETFVYAMAFDVADQNVAAMPLNPDGTVGAPSIQSTGLAGISAHAFARGEKFLIVTSDEDDLIVSFAVDPDTGALTQVDSQAITGAERINALVTVTR